MSAQELLTFLFNAITLSFGAIATIDFSTRVIALYKQVFITSEQPRLITTQPQALPQLPDPWLLPQEAAAGASVVTDRGIQSQPKPVLLLAPAKAIGEERSRSVGAAQLLDCSDSTLEELLSEVDLDTIKLRQARKIAKVLGIVQKINGKDQKLSWLRAEIQASLQQGQSLGQHRQLLPN